MPSKRSCTKDKSLTYITHTHTSKIKSKTFPSTFQSPPEGRRIISWGLEKKGGNDTSYVSCALRNSTPQHFWSHVASIPWFGWCMQCNAKQSKNLSYLRLDIGANCFSSKLELPTHIQVFKWMEKGVQIWTQKQKKRFQSSLTSTTKHWHVSLVQFWLN
jgi:hypothetical protein